MDEEKKRRLQELYGNNKMLAAIFGTGMTGMEMQNPAPNLLNMGLGGAMQGFGMAGPLGALLGGVGGLLGGAKKRGDFEAAQRQQYEDMFTNKRSEPSFYAKNGGMVMPIDGEVATLQTEKGEVAAMPDGMIVDVMSKKKHKDMKKDVVTDVFPAGTFIADTDGELKREDAKDYSLGSMPMTYTEEGEKEKYKEVLLSDLFGKNKKLKTAQLLGKVKKEVKMPERVADEIHDPFAMAAAQDNLATRGKYIQAVMNLSARSDRKLRKEILGLQQMQQDATELPTT